MNLFDCLKLTVEVVASLAGIYEKFVRSKMKDPQRELN